MNDKEFDEMFDNYQIVKGGSRNLDKSKVYLDTDSIKKIGNSAYGKINKKCCINCKNSTYCLVETPASLCNDEHCKNCLSIDCEGYLA
jgi:hypothetical protein